MRFCISLQNLPTWCRENACDTHMAAKRARRDWNEDVFPILPVKMLFSAIFVIGSAKCPDGMFCDGLGAGFCVIQRHLGDSIRRCL